MPLNHWLSSLTKLLFASVPLASALLAPSVALAVDTKTYLGTACTPASSFSANSFWSLDGVILNATGDFAEVACPIVKSVPNNAALDSVVVNTDLVGDGSVMCTLTVHSANIPNNQGAILLASVTGQVTGSGQQAITFSNFGAGLGSPWQTSNWFFYQLNCNLSEFASIRSYAVAEAGTHNENQKTYPSSMCRQDDRLTNGEWFFGQSFVQAGQGDTFGSQVGFVCPIITDRTANTTATSIAEISVGRPIAAGTALTCTMYASSNFSGVVAQRTATAPAGPEFPSLRLNLDLNTSPTWARYNIHCTMPGTGDSKIISYRISEN